MTNIKVSLPGNDVESADVNLAFSSDWPNVRIIKSGELKVLGETFTTIPHTLGLTPAFLTWGPSSGYLDMPRQNVFVTNSNFYWSHPGNGSQLDDLFLMVFDIDIETEYHAPTFNQSTSSSAQSVSDAGIRFTKLTKDITSTDLRDYILHSSARSPLLHAVIPKTIGVSGNFSYTHDLPYSPIFMVYAEQSIATGPAYVLLNNFAGVTTSGQTITVSGITSGNKVSIVILKDPFYIDSNVQVVKL